MCSEFLHISRHNYGLALQYVLVMAGTEVVYYPQCHKCETVKRIPLRSSSITEQIEIDGFSFHLLSLSRAEYEGGLIAKKSTFRKYCTKVTRRENVARYKKFAEAREENTSLPPTLERIFSRRWPLRNDTRVSLGTTLTAHAY